MWVLSFAAPANYLHKRQVISSFAVNHTKQQLTIWRSRPIVVQKFLSQVTNTWLLTKCKANRFEQVDWVTKTVTLEKEIKKKTEKWFLYLDIKKQDW